MSRPGNVDAQFALFTDYANHVARFDELAAYHRVLERMGAHIYDGGHLLLETHAAECTQLMRAFVLDDA
ncbi:hypothetical protein AB0J85_21245 [Micromonospora echinofusca]|uniref:hypothetical protein n=1 Tax=Micromonospora echinofusca TaxID=47858 RepID=UPI003422554F